MLMTAKIRGWKIIGKSDSVLVSRYFFDESCKQKPHENSKTKIISSIRRRESVRRNCERIKKKEKKNKEKEGEILRANER